MKIVIGIIFLAFLIGCSPSGDKGRRDAGIEILLSQIYINHYEDDSLNTNRGYVIPRIYYYFEYKNPSSDSVYIVLDQFFDEETGNGPFLYSLFEYNAIQDTVVLADYESVNPILISPKESGIFEVGAPIYNFLEKDIYKNETAATLMKYIADNSVVSYCRPSLGKHEIVLESQSIRKSKNFKVFFRDPEDTAVE